MAQKEYKINVKVVGFGKSKFGMWLLCKIAKIYLINLEVVEL